MGNFRGTKYLFRSLLRENRSRGDQAQTGAILPGAEQLYTDVKLNESQLRSLYANSSDVVFRSFIAGGQTRALLVYLDGMSDTEAIDRNVMVPLMSQEAQGCDFGQLVERVVTVSQVHTVATFQECMNYLSRGHTILLCDGVSSAYALGLTRWEKRGIEEPQAEVGVRGPREGFTETLRTNTSQLRRIIKSPHLKLESMRIGKYTQTEVVIAYIDGVANASLIEEVRERLSRIRIDGILESSYLEEMIQDHPYSPFPQMLSTERPDVVSSGLLEGRVAILTEGTPFALVVPITLISLLQSQEDYYQPFMASTAIRWLRYSFIVLALLLPSIYVAVSTFHQEMVPGPLLISMARSRESVPFPALVEAVMMEVVFEALREAGVRLPKQVGAAVSIVGALVIGQAAVEAGLVSAPMVIVVAITGIATFMVPRYVSGISVRLLRFPLIFLSGTLGLIGLMMGVIAIFLHLAHIRTFGVPYLSDIAMPKLSEWKDVLIRTSWKKMNTRPKFAGPLDNRREPSNPPTEAGGKDEG